MFSPQAYKPELRIRFGAQVVSDTLALLIAALALLPDRQRPVMSVLLMLLIEVCNLHPAPARILHQASHIEKHTAVAKWLRKGAHTQHLGLTCRTQCQQPLQMPELAYLQHVHA